MRSKEHKNLGQQQNVYKSMPQKLRSIDIYIQILGQVC
jgi:hypothetical protein